MERVKLESEIEEMNETLNYMDAMRIQLLEEKKQKENELKQLNKSLGKIDTSKIEIKEPEILNTKKEESVIEIPQLIEQKPLKKRPRRVVRK